RYAASPWEWSVTAPDKTVRDDYVPALRETAGVSRNATYTVEMPAGPSSETSKPGVLRPGQLAEFASLAGCKALVPSVATRVSMQRSGSGAAALVVWQTVELGARPAEPRYNYVLVSGEQEGLSAPVIRDGTAG